MAMPVSGDLDEALGAIEDEGHGDDRLKGIALCAPVGRDVGLAITDADTEVEGAVERRLWQPWAVVGTSMLQSVTMTR